MRRAPGGAVLAAAGIAAEYGGELYPRTCPARSSTPLLAGEAGISATLESGRTMSWATPVRSHVVVTMMARSITVERSVPALLGLSLEFPVWARRGAARRGTGLSCIRALRWTSKNYRVDSRGYTMLGCPQGPEKEIWQPRSQHVVL